VTGDREPSAGVGVQGVNGEVRGSGMGQALEDEPREEAGSSMQRGAHGMEPFMGDK
jgi:hypothetical protein